MKSIYQKLDEMTAKKLRDIIRGEINPNIKLHRQMKGFPFLEQQFHFPIEEEVDNFLYSIPYFEKSLSLYIINPTFLDGCSTCLFIKDDWQQEFEENVRKWANSDEWLYDEELMLRHLHLYEKEDLFKDCRKLNLPPRIMFVRI